MGVLEELVDLVAELGELDSHSRLLVAAARALAVEIDGDLEPDDGKSVKKSAASAVRELKATVSELVARCTDDGDDDAAWDFAEPDSPKVRDAKESVKGDVRRRGRGDREAVGEAVDAVAAVRGRRRTGDRPGNG